MTRIQISWFSNRKSTSRNLSWHLDLSGECNRTQVEANHQLLRWKVVNNVIHQSLSCKLRIDGNRFWRKGFFNHKMAPTPINKGKIYWKSRYFIYSWLSLEWWKEEEDSRLERSLTWKEAAILYVHARWRRKEKVSGFCKATDPRVTFRSAGLAKRLRK